MASSSRNQAGDDTDIPLWFRTTVDPSKDHIHICPKWLNKYSDSIDFEKSGVVTSLQKKATRVVFKSSHGRWFLSSGIMVARTNDFVEPTQVILFYKQENNFKIWIDHLGPQISSLPRAPDVPNMNVSGCSSNPGRSFNTIINPLKVPIKLCQNFIKQWFSKLHFLEYASINNPATNKESLVNFRKINGKWCLISGIDVAKENGFTEPTKVVLYFEGRGNKFSMYPAVGKNQTNDKPDIVDLSSGPEDESYDDQNQYSSNNADNNEEITNDGDDGSIHNETVEDGEFEEYIDPTPFYTFEVNITEAMDKKAQVFHFPNKTSRYVLLQDQTMIGLRDIETGIVFDCPIKTATRNSVEKYIGASWEKYKKRKKLRVGDVVQCEIEYPPHLMNVNVVRRRGGRR
ncbi:hypothetical protein TSUD_272660 [Trifolium subterraneum]|uniref:TF-B3 domain-containing protein n=1 Tax=Trifolium subterraneum TaxID=3900 RepID=A0A2Z6NZK2_TRISU|nr:hypothetical protein TSUD_272660 [Trifolium subterraneum]